jgi:hypothetical protein
LEICCYVFFFPVLERVERIQMNETSIRKTPTAQSPKETQIMNRSPFSLFHSCMTVATATVLLAAGLTARVHAKDNRAPAVPSDIAVPEGHKVHFHGYALGFQIYTWNGVSWGASVPDAILLDDDGNMVATHYAGPTWKSNSGSRVVGVVVPPRVTVDPDAIPWLLLAAVPANTEGPGIFANTTYIQRVNTSGGKAPARAGYFFGEVACVPYTAEYYFYRQAND